MQDPCLICSTGQTLLSEQESYSVLKFILIQWGASAFITAPLQPLCLIVPHLPRGVHHSASQMLISCSLPLPRRKQKTALALVASGEAKAEEHP